MSWSPTGPCSTGFGQRAGEDRGPPNQGRDLEEACGWDRADEGKIRMRVRHINRTRLATDQPKVLTPISQYEPRTLTVFLPGYSAARQRSQLCRSSTDTPEHCPHRHQPADHGDAAPDDSPPGVASVFQTCLAGQRLAAGCAGGCRSMLMPVASSRTVRESLVHTWVWCRRPQHTSRGTR